MENEFYHHGVKGQRWGIRRYQNKDGSLTAAGKKRAAKLESDYSELTGKKIGDTSGGSSGNSSRSSKPKSISEMSNEEIQARIDRLGLENKLQSLTPEHVSTGKKIVNGLRETAISIAKDKGTRIVGDYVDKKLRTKLGLKETKSESEILKEKAQDAINRYTIAKNEKSLSDLKKHQREEAANEKKSRDAKKQVDDYVRNGSKDDRVRSTTYRMMSENMNDNKVATGRGNSNRLSLEEHAETVSGKVEGEGTSRYKPNKGPIIDVYPGELNRSTIQSGQSFVTALLEDRNRR